MKKLIILSLLCVSCAHKNDLALPEKPYLKDPVSVRTAITLAHSAYLRGCTNYAKSRGDEGFAKECVEGAKKYVQEDIIEVLNQGPKEPLN